MTKNSRISKHGHKDFVTQFRAITLRVYNLATKFAKNSDSLSSEKELAIIWYLYHKEEDKAN